MHQVAFLYKHYLLSEYEGWTNATKTISQLSHDCRKNLRSLASLRTWCKTW